MLKFNLRFIIYSIFLYLRSHDLFAQNQVETVFDSNCEVFARDKKNILVKGTLDSKKSTERYFNWDNITPSYKNYVSQIEQKISTNGYSSPMEMVLSENVSINQSTAFKSYCIETIATKGMDEELHKWTVHVSNCMNVVYFSKHPEHCTGDQVKSLNYLAYHAKQLSKIEGSKSPLTVKFFQEAQKTFSDSANNLNKLIESQKLAKQAAEEKAKKENDLAAIQQTMDRCSKIVIEDENDVYGRSIADKISMGLDGCAPIEEHSDSLNVLIKDMENINNFVVQNHLFDEMNNESLTQSLHALWSTSERFGKVFSNNESERKVKLMNLACVFEKSLCSNEKTNKVVNEAFNKYLTITKKKPLVALTDQDINQIVTNDFNKPLRDMRKNCEDTYKTVIDSDKSHSCFGVKTMRECDGIRDEHYSTKSRVTYFSYHDQKKMYEQMIQSPFAGLLLTEGFKKKVGSPSEGNCGQNQNEPLDYPTRLISSADFKQAQNDYLDLIKGEIKSVNENFQKGAPKSQGIRNYLKTHPQTVSDLLNKNPNQEYAVLLCKYIRDINKTDDRKQTVQMIATGVGIVSSVALAMTGVGAPAAGALMVAIAGATSIDIAVSVSKYKDSKLQSEQTLQAGATGQMDLYMALAEYPQWRDQSQSEMENTIIIIGSELATLGIGRMIPLISKLRQAKAIKFFTKGVSKGAEIDKESLAMIKKGLEDFNVIAKNKGLSPLLIKNISPDEMMGLGAFFSKLSKADTELVALEIKKMNSSEFSRFLKEISENPENFIFNGKLSFVEIKNAVNVAKKPRLPGGKLYEDVSDQVDLLTSKLNFSKNIEKNISLTHDFYPLSTKLGKDAPENLFKYLDSLNAHESEKFLNLFASDSTQALKTIEKLDCLGKGINSACLDSLKAAISTIPETKPLSFIGLNSKIGKIDKNFESTLKNSRLSQLEIDHLVSNLPKNKLNPDQLKELEEYLSFLSTQPLQKRMNGLEKSMTLFQAGKTEEKIIKEFKDLQTLSNKKMASWEVDIRNNIKKENPNLSKEQQVELTNIKLRDKKIKFEERVAACRSKVKNSYTEQGMKKFDRFNVIANPAFSATTYIMSKFDQEKDEVWFKSLGWEVITGIVYGKIPGYVMKNRMSSDVSMMLKNTTLGAGINLVDSQLYYLLVMNKTEQEKKELKKIMEDPDFEKNLEILNSKMNEMVQNPEFDQILFNHKAELDEYEALLNEENMDFTELSMEDYKSDPDLAKLLIEADTLNSLHDESTLTGDKSYDRFLFTTSFNFLQAPKVLLVNNLLSRQICMGNYASTLGIYTFNKLVTGEIYYKTKEKMIGQ